MRKIKIEGLADFASNEIVCICGSCGNHDKENAMIEFNFREQKVFYLCSKCKVTNELAFGKEKLPPMPKTRM